MLFLDPKYFKLGYGTEILQTLIQEHKVQYVDVNKDNPNALSFYLKMDSKNMMNLQKMDRVGIIQSYILNCKLSYFFHCISDCVWFVLSTLTPFYKS